MPRLPRPPPVALAVPAALAARRPLGTVAAPAARARVEGKGGAHPWRDHRVAPGVASPSRSTPVPVVPGRRRVARSEDARCGRARALGLTAPGQAHRRERAGHPHCLRRPGNSSSPPCRQDAPGRGYPPPPSATNSPSPSASPSSMPASLVAPRSPPPSPPLERPSRPGDRTGDPTLDPAASAAAFAAREGGWFAALTSANAATAAAAAASIVSPTAAVTGTAASAALARRRAGRTTTRATRVVVSTTILTAAGTAASAALAARSTAPGSAAAEGRRGVGHGGGKPVRVVVLLSRYVTL